MSVKSSLPNHSPANRRRNRRGAAVVELAACLPLIMLLVFGAVEAASLLFARQAMVEAAYEAAVVAVRSTSTLAEARSAAANVVKTRRLDGLTLTFNPADVENAPRGTLIRVTADVPVGRHQLLGSQILRVNRISASATMAKE